MWAMVYCDYLVEMAQSLAASEEVRVQLGDSQAAEMSLQHSDTQQLVTLDTWHLRVYLHCQKKQDGTDSGTPALLD